MALSGNLIADFSSFTTACAQAVSSLKDIEGDSSKVGASLNRMSDSLSGVKIVQQATIAAEAVDRIGGVSQLTEKELAKVGAIATEAANKLRAMGQDVPPGIQRIADAADKTTGSFGSLLARVGESAAGFFTAQAAINLLEGAFGTLVSAGEHLWTTVLSGASIADVEENFKHLTTQAGLLGDVLLGELKSGTHDTVTTFELMKVVNQNMAAGLNLTTAQFGTLAKGAFALAQATGGDVKTALDTMSDAMVTGRTKGLALLTGKIDMEAAEIKYAASLGKTRDNLTDAGKMEAARAATLDAVSASTARLGVQTDGLDERVAQAQVSWANFEEELGKTIASSPALEAGLAGVKDMLIEAFGGSQESLVKAIASAVDTAAIALVDFSQFGVVGAGMVAKEFITLKAELTAVALLLTGAVDVAMNKDADSVMRLGGAIKDSVRSIGEVIVAHAKVDLSTAEWTARLETLRAKMEAARAGSVALVDPLGAEAGAHDRAGKAADAHGEALTKLSAKDLAAAQKLQALEAAALLNVTKLWDEYYALRTSHGGTANDIAIAQIDRWAADLTAQMIKAGTDTADFYDALAAVSKAKLAAVGVDWNFMRANSIEGLQEIADNARRTYDEMVFGAQHFTREVLEAQLEKVRETAQAATAMGTEFEVAFQRAEAAAALATQKIADTQAAAERAALAMRSIGNSMTYDLSTKAGMDKFKELNPMATINADTEYFKTHTIQDAVEAGLINFYGKWGKGLPGFAEGVDNFGGGWAVVGERGPEVVNLPGGSAVRPFGSGGGGSVTIQNTFHLVDTEANLVQRVSDAITRSVMQGQRLGVAR